MKLEDYILKMAKNEKIWAEESTAQLIDMFRVKDTQGIIEFFDFELFNVSNRLSLLLTLQLPMKVDRNAIIKNVIESVMKIQEESEDNTLNEIRRMALKENNKVDISFVDELYLFKEQRDKMESE